MSQNAATEPHTERPAGGFRRVVNWFASGNEITVTILAIVVALIIGSLLIIFTDEQTRNAFGYFFSAPGDAFRYAWDAISSAYVALAQGAVYNPQSPHALDAISNTLYYSTPMILCGLAVAVPFRAGLFNIGGQGQIIAGAVCAAYVGFTWQLPAVLHVILATIAGIIGGMVWGGIAGILKAKTGAHEVVVTIMLNWVGFNLIGWLLTVKGFTDPKSGQQQSLPINSSALMPRIFGHNEPVTLMLVIAILCAIACWWMLRSSTTGFEIRAVGANPSAAKTAGMSSAKTFFLVMVVGGGLAGLAGVAQSIGTQPAWVGQSVDAGIGFTGITVALLARGNPLGVILAGLLFGALTVGGQTMQSKTGTSIELVTVLQSTIVLFIAAPAFIKSLFHLRRAESGAMLAKGWSS